MDDEAVAAALDGVDSDGGADLDVEALGVALEIADHLVAARVVLGIPGNGIPGIALYPTGEKRVRLS